MVDSIPNLEPSAFELEVHKQPVGGHVLDTFFLKLFAEDLCDSCHVICNVICQ